MQEQANQHVLPVQASKPSRCLLRLLLVCVHFVYYQFNRVLGQQVSPASQVPIAYAGASASQTAELACILGRAYVNITC